ncbi:MAG: PspC domain-containing protein [Chloroflexota bacterium]
MTDRLYRSPTDQVIAGVAGGMATWLDIDPSLIRIAWALLAIGSAGIVVLVYIVMMIVVPLPPPGWVPTPARRWTPGSGAVPGWTPGETPGGGAVPGGNQGGTPGWNPGETQSGTGAPAWSPDGSPAPGGATSPAWAPGGATSPPWAPGGATSPAWAPGGATSPAWAPGPTTGAPQPGPGWGSAYDPAQRTPERGRAGLVGGIVLIALGAWFLIERYVDIDWSLVWPVVIIALGGLLIAASAGRRRH